MEGQSISYNVRLRAEQWEALQNEQFVLKQKIGQIQKFQGKKKDYCASNEIYMIEDQIFWVSHSYCPKNSCFRHLDSYYAKELIKKLRSELKSEENSSKTQKMEDFKNKLKLPDNSVAYNFLPIPRTMEFENYWLKDGNGKKGKK
eukprot:GHVP01029004.1.p1 GENE.GHVP01029004.1~~GHVP01029004.1.p1  ORF type:complete len:162 (-),score=29.09 GHVP01029004.1:625-1059(-)